MTVYDFMHKMGEYEAFHIVECGTSVTGSEPTSLHDIKVHNDERESVLDALEKQVVTIDAVEWVIYCE